MPPRIHVSGMSGISAQKRPRSGGPITFTNCSQSFLDRRRMMREIVVDADSV
jgi:hypothetical protein